MFIRASPLGCLLAGLALGMLDTPIEAAAQVSEHVPVVGVLSPGMAASPIGVRGREAFEQGLKALGWIPGQTIYIEYRFAEGREERLDELARDLVRLRVDVIVARANQPIQAAKRATKTIPIVMSASGYDPTLEGLVASLARPGGNITGLTLLIEDLQLKQLELLKEVVPRLSRVAVLGSAALALSPKGRQRLVASAQALGLALHFVDVRGPDDLDRAFAGIARARASGLLVRADPFVFEPDQGRVVALALRHKLPAIYWLPTYVHAGGLVSYGADLLEVHRRSAYYVDRILRGSLPAELPVEEPTKFALVVNLRTARALGLTIPEAILLRADEVVR